MMTRFHLTRSLLARGERGGTLSVCRFPADSLLWAREAHIGPITALAWDPQAHLLASGGRDGLVHVWQAATGTRICTFSHGRKVACLSWSEDGSCLSSASGSTIQIWTVSGQIDVASAA